MNTAHDFAGKVVVITGASAGVGRAAAREFARAGARLALIARDAAALEETRAELVALGAEVLIAPLDVADAGAVSPAADRVETELGPIEVWVNNAMATVFAPVSAITAEEVRRVTEVTYLGYVHGTMAALRHMRPRDRGAIVQIGSSLAYRGIPLQAAYCGAKHAIRGFTDSLRAELIHEKSGIHLTMVQLPAVNTPQFDWARAHISREPRPVAPVYAPEPVARAILAAARGRGREYWLGLSTVGVILGNMVWPSFLDRYLARNAISGQMRESLLPPDRPDNLEHPVHEPHAAHGSFGAEARSSLGLWPGGLARLAVIGLGVAVAASAGGLIARAASAGKAERRSRLPRGRR